MTARRAARSHRPPAAKIQTTDGALPVVLRLGPLVEVWGETAEVPPGRDARATAYFEAAINRYSSVRTAVDPGQANRHRPVPAAWSMDGRVRSSKRLRGIRADSSPHGSEERLAAVGCTVDDLPALRQAAIELVVQAGGSA